MKKKYEDKTVDEQVRDFDEVMYYLGECSEENGLAVILLEELGKARKLIKCRQALESFLKQLGIDTDKQQDND